MRDVSEATTALQDPSSGLMTMAVRKPGMADGHLKKTTHSGHSSYKHLCLTHSLSQSQSGEE